MARLKPGWEAHERDLQERLGLSATLNSGNQFYDSGDAVDNDGSSPWPLWVDGKYTAAKSYSIKRDEIDAMRERAEMLGKRFGLAVRFYDARNPRLCADYMVITLEDYEEMLSIVRSAADA